MTVLGTSGSGKSTLLKLINRLLEPSFGHILVHGERTSQIPAPQLRRGLGYVIQHIGLFPHMTVADNIAVVPKILRWPKKRISERIDELLDLVALEPQAFRNRFPRQLSGGQQQRVGLARALAGDPSILLMDEPFGAVDALTRQTLQTELSRILRKLGKTVVLVTHDVQEALSLGDKVIVMDSGRVQQYDRPEHLLKHPANGFVKRLLETGLPSSVMVQKRDAV